MGKATKEKLHRAIEEMPEKRLKELLDYMESLLQKDRSDSKPEANLDPANDPLLEFIGGVSHGSLAKGIDDELYTGND